MLTLSAPDQHPMGQNSDETASDEKLVLSLRSGDRAAAAALVDQFGAHIQGVLVNVLGLDPELPDLLHEVFARALVKIDNLRDPSRLKAWLTSIAVFTARECIRARTRRRWLRRSLQEGTPAFQFSATATEEVREAIRCTYEILERLPVNERIAFTLRFVSGMALTEVAAACGVSLATIKRRLSRAEQRFRRLAGRKAPLQPWLGEEFP